MGGAPAGPAGTGKTETVKDMGRAIGLAVYVFNCSAQMSFQTLANIFQGLAASGTWGCFDEFNRISIEVLSVVATQVRTVFEAVRSRAPVFSLGADVGDDGKAVYLPLRREVGIFVTMNPGYKGRTELPANVKALFRPCAMVVPDVQQISEILLSAEGFVSAKSLAVKFARCYTYAKQQLSAQMQYDWGLRAMRAVLLVAGNGKRAALSRMMAARRRSVLVANTGSKRSKTGDLATAASSQGKSSVGDGDNNNKQQQRRSHSTKKREEEEKEEVEACSPVVAASSAAVDTILTLSQEQESLIFARALYTSNLAKLHVGDVALLRRLILALFPDVSAQALVQMGDVDVDTRDLLNAVKTEAKQSVISLGDDGAFLRKIAQLVDALKVRHSIFVMGPPLSGKSSLWRLLSSAYESVGLRPWIEVIEPKTLSSDELYGFVHPQSHEWYDGILSKTFRAFALAAAAPADDQHHHHHHHQQENKNTPETTFVNGTKSVQQQQQQQQHHHHHQHSTVEQVPKWIVMDGVIDPNWVETMNSVMDDNKLLTLQNNERIALTPTMRLVFEIGNLAHATPATVSRAGIVLMNDGDVSWSAVKDRFIALQADPTHKNLLDALMEKHMSTALLWAQDSMPKDVVSLNDGGDGAMSSSSSSRSRAIEWTRSICALFQGIIQQEEFRVCYPLPIEIVEPLFVWCIGFVLGSMIPYVTQSAHVGTNFDSRYQFSHSFRRQFPVLKYGDSASATLFDFRPTVQCLDNLLEGVQPIGTINVPWTPPKRRSAGGVAGGRVATVGSPAGSPLSSSPLHSSSPSFSSSPTSSSLASPQAHFLSFRFVRWDAATPQQSFALHPCTPWTSQVIPAPDALRMQYMLNVLMSQPDGNVLLVGPTCSAKTLFARDFWLRASTSLKCRYINTEDVFAKKWRVANHLDQHHQSGGAGGGHGQQNQTAHDQTANDHDDDEQCDEASQRQNDGGEAADKANNTHDDDNTTQRTATRTAAASAAGASTAADGSLTTGIVSMGRRASLLAQNRQPTTAATASQSAKGGGHPHSFSSSTNNATASPQAPAPLPPPPPEYIVRPVRAVNFSSWSYTSDRGQVQPEIEQHLERRGPHVLGPSGGAHLVLIVDDLNLPQVDEFGSSSSLSLVRQLLSLKMLYDKERLQSKDVEDVRVLATLDPAREGCAAVDDRLTSRFVPFVLGVPHEEQSKFLLNCLMTAHCNAARMKHDLLSDLSRVSSLFVDVLQYVTGAFSPTESFPQHRFTLRDLCRAAEGLCRALRPRTSTSTSLPAAIIFHLGRAVSDRLGTSGFMHHVAHFIRESTLNRFADNAGAADLLELGQDAVFFPPPALLGANAVSGGVGGVVGGRDNNNHHSNAGGVTSSSSAAAAAPPAGGDDDPDKAKKPMLGCHTPYVCGAIQSENDMGGGGGGGGGGGSFFGDGGESLSSPTRLSSSGGASRLFPSYSMIGGNISTSSSVGGSGGSNASSGKALTLDSSCVSNITSVEGEGGSHQVLDRVHSAYSDWSCREFQRLDSLGMLQRAIEQGIVVSSSSSPSAANGDQHQQSNNASSSSASSPSLERETVLQNFVFFDAALVQIAAVARVMSSPAGHLLLLGLGGSGRRYVLRLAAMYLGYELVSADVSSIAEDSSHHSSSSSSAGGGSGGNKDVAEWRATIGSWQKRAVLKDQKFCVAVTGCENTTSGGDAVLAYIHELLREGVCFPCLTNEEREEIVSAVQSQRGTLPTHLQTPYINADMVPAPFEGESFVWDSFVTRSRQNLRFAIVMSLIPTQIRTLRRRFPALTDECQVLHSHPWSKSALANVCRRMFMKANVIAPEQDDNDDVQQQQQQQQQQQRQQEGGNNKKRKNSAALSHDTNNDDTNDSNVGDADAAGQETNEDENTQQSLVDDVVGKLRIDEDDEDTRRQKDQAKYKYLSEDVARDVTDLLAQTHSLVVRQLQTTQQQQTSNNTKSSSSSSSSSSRTASAGRRVLVSPKHFLQSVSMFIKLLNRKNVDVSGQIHRLREGLLRIDDCEEQVEELKKRITVEGAALQKKSIETNDLLRNVEEEKKIVSEQHMIAEVEEQKTKKLVSEVTVLVKDCDNELQLALPAVHAAKEALKTLNKQNLTELKSMGKPPADVHAVTACVMCLSNPPFERLPRDRSWSAAKTRMMGDVGKWLRELQDFDVNNIPEQNVNAVRPTIADPTFNRAVISQKSFAAAGLCEWVINIVKYHDLHQLFIPKEQRLKDARARQADSEAKLEKVRAKLADLQKKLDAVVQRYEGAKAEQMRLENMVRQTESHLDRARRLVASLGGERKRWTYSCEQLERDARRVAPDMAMAAAFFVYAGPFPFAQRRSLWDDIVRIASSVNLIVVKQQGDMLAAAGDDNDSNKKILSAAGGGGNSGGGDSSAETGGGTGGVGVGDAPVSTLFSEADLAHWSSCFLPSDSFSRQSAAIVRVNEGAASPTVVIDPQHRANAWISETLRQKMASSAMMSRNGIQRRADGAEKQLQNTSSSSSSAASAKSSSFVDPTQLLTVVQPDSPKLLATLSNAIHAGRCCMVAGVSQISRQLLAVMEGLNASKGSAGDGIVKIGANEFSLHSDFRLYIQFLDADASVGAECYTLSSVVDFSATEDGFVEQLLDRALQLDRPELQEELAILLRTMNNMTVSLREREDNMLEQLATAGTTILDDESLVSSLEKTRTEAKSMQKTLDASLEKKRVATEATRLYLPVALRATTVFLRLQAMRAVDPIYSFSIDPVLEEFDRGIRMAQDELRQVGGMSGVFADAADDSPQVDASSAGNNNNNNNQNAAADAATTSPTTTLAGSGDANNNPTVVTTTKSSAQQQQQQQQQQQPTDNMTAAEIAALESKKLEDTAARVELMRKTVTECIFLYGARAIFSAHKLTYAASVSLAILLQEGYPHITTVHIDTLLRFPRRLDCQNMPASAQWLSLPQWQSLDGLCRVRVPASRTFQHSGPESGTDNTSTDASKSSQQPAAVTTSASEAHSSSSSPNMPFGWKQPFQGLLDDIMSNARWRTWVAHAAPETEKPPGTWRGISDVEQLLLVRCLRPDRFAAALSHFVSTHLGSFAVNEEQLDLQSVLKRHHAATPFLFVVSAGADAANIVNDVAARAAGYDERTGTVAHISLGQGQEEKALNCLQRAFRERCWVVLHNVHLLPSWSFKLERELARFHEECKTMPGNDGRTLLREDLPSDTVFTTGVGGTGTAGLVANAAGSTTASAGSAGGAAADTDAASGGSATLASFEASALGPDDMFDGTSGQQQMQQQSYSDTHQFAQPLAYPASSAFPGGPQNLTVLCEADVKLLSLTESIANNTAVAQNASASSGGGNKNNQKNTDGLGMSMSMAASGGAAGRRRRQQLAAASSSQSGGAGGDDQSGEDTSPQSGGIMINRGASDPKLRGFRVFLTAEPRDQPLLGNLVNRCIKVVCEPPQGVASNFIRAYSNFEDEPWEGSPRPNEMHGIVFSLCFFHSLVTERSKFGAIGWNKKYPFSIEDLKCAAEIAVSASESSARVQWTHLRFFISRIVYGGHIVDPFDLRLCSTYLDLLLSPELLESGDIVSGIPMPGRRTHEEMMRLLQEQFPEEEPSMFHMHAASAARKGTVESQQLVSVLGAVVASATLASGTTYCSRGGGGGAGGASTSVFASAPSGAASNADGGQQQQASSSSSPSSSSVIPSAIQDDTIALLIGSVPELLPVSVVTERIEMEGMDNASPLQLLMLREAERMNRLTSLMRGTLESLDLAERGGRFLTEEDRDVMAALKRDEIPDGWLAQWGPTVRPLGAWIVLVTEAFNYLLNWCNDLSVPRTICVRYLFSPSALFSALQQDAAAKLGVSLETVDLSLDVLKTRGGGNKAGSAGAGAGGAGAAGGFLGGGAEIAGHRQREGAVIVGLTLDGAAWDAQSNSLCEAPPGVIDACSMPAVAIRGAASSSSRRGGGELGDKAGAGSGAGGSATAASSASAIPPDKPNTYFCPLYRTWRRGESWIITLPLRTREPMSKWVLRSVALIADDHSTQ